MLRRHRTTESYLPLASLQIWHVGRASHPHYQPNEELPISASSLPISELWAFDRGVTPRAVWDTIGQQGGVKTRRGNVHALTLMCRSVPASISPLGLEAQTPARRLAALQPTATSASA